MGAVSSDVGCALREQDAVRFPGHGFFLKAQVLGVFSGDPTGPESRAFHADELQRVLSYYGSEHPHLVFGAS